MFGASFPTSAVRHRRLNIAVRRRLYAVAEAYGRGDAGEPAGSTTMRVLAASSPQPGPRGAGGVTGKSTKSPPAGPVDNSAVNTFT